MLNFDMTISSAMARPSLKTKNNLGSKKETKLTQINYVAYPTYANCCEGLLDPACDNHPLDQELIMFSRR